jgi:hypothetical protein
MYRGRLITDRSQLAADPEATRVVMVDDWTLSGEQFSKTYTNFAKVDPDSPYLSRLEVDVVIATPELINGGFMPTEEGFSLTRQPLPVNAYYTAQPRMFPTPDPEDHDIIAHISGAHSSVDYSFGVQLKRMVEEDLDNLPHIAGPVKLPALADTEKTYRHESLARIQRLEELNTQKKE